MTTTINESSKNQSEPTTELKRGGCLTAFLIAMFVINPIVGIIYLLGLDQMENTYPDTPTIVFIILALLTFINLGLAIATWNWRKIGVYGFWASAVLALAINLSLGLASWTSLLGFLGPIIITLLVKPKWSEFK